MRITAFYSVLLFLLVVNPAWATNANFVELDNQLRQQDFAGVIWIAKGDSIVHNESFGLANRKKNITFSDNTVFDIGSITKQFVASAVLLLAEQNKLSVNDPLTLFFADVPADKQAITLHHLLTHTSGLPALLSNHQLYDVVPYSLLPQKAFSESLQSLPGEQYLYSNIGYSLLARVIELVSGQNWEGFIRENLLIPAKMTETGYRIPEYAPHRLAINYGADQNGFQRLFNLQAKSKSVGHSLEHRFKTPGERWIEGAGGFMSTVNDMQRWFRVLRSGAILTEASWQQIFTPHVQISEKVFYGYGWSVREFEAGKRLITHNGSNGYSFAEFSYFPDEDVFVFVATNERDEYPEAIINDIKRAALSADSAVPTVTH
ncbi:serine hydrolase [Alteromonas lipolytica]|uniref:Serine hydrolase n=2 Tax=Alteromonas lipolytica TaxID=1856405 RepID=A0A1E8FHH6_9ALTE|nr:serine hydrolase [Alteromonas lipolytica]